MLCANQICNAPECHAHAIAPLSQCCPSVFRWLSTLLLLVLLLLLLLSCTCKSCVRAKSSQCKHNQLGVRSFQHAAQFRLSANANKHMFVFLYVDVSLHASHDVNKAQLCVCPISFVNWRAHDACSHALSNALALSGCPNSPSPTHWQNSLNYCAPFKLSTKWTPLSCYDNSGAFYKCNNIYAARLWKFKNTRVHSQSSPSFTIKCCQS